MTVCRDLGLAVSLAVLAATPALAGSLPAVSGVNGKVAAAGGIEDGDGGALSEASLSLPLGHAFGFQADGLLGYIGGQKYEVAAGNGHLFWRDPSIGLLGAYAGVTSFGGESFYRYAGEGQLYFDRISLEGLFGHDVSDLDDGLFWLGQLAYYPSDDLRVSAGLRYANWRDDRLAGPGRAAFAGVEYQAASTPDYGLSLFAEGRSDGGGYNSVWGGVRVYFGGDKTLIRRHREDDPGVVIPMVSDVDVDTPIPDPPVIPFNPEEE